MNLRRRDQMGDLWSSGAGKDRAPAEGMRRFEKCLSICVAGVRSENPAELGWKKSETGTYWKQDWEDRGSSVSQKTSWGDRPTGKCLGHLKLEHLSYIQLQVQSCSGQVAGGCDGTQKSHGHEPAGSLRV